MNLHVSRRVTLVVPCLIALGSCNRTESPTELGRVIGDQPVLQASGPACIAPPSGLVSWWPGDGDANDVRDGNDGALNGVTFAAGKVGDAFDFGGSLDHVTIRSNANINFTSDDPYTIAFWVKTAVVTTGHPALVEKWSLPQNMPYPFAVRLNTAEFPGPDDLIGTAFCASFDTEEFPSVSSEDKRIDDNTFHHVACVFDHPSKRIDVYVDGQLENSVTYTDLGDISNDIDLFLGLRGEDPPNAITDFGGLLDEVQIFDRDLAPDEINAMFSADSDGQCQTPQDLTGLLIRQVEDLVAAGGLKGAHSNRLINELEKAIVRFDGNDSGKGCQELEKFVSEVTKLIEQAKLAEEDGLPLIDLADQTITLACG